VRLAVSLLGSRLIIDWHNTGESILGLRLGQGAVATKLAGRLEAHFGRNAFVHLFVTEAMRFALVQRWRLNGKTAVLYDRPPSQFSRLDASERRNLLDSIRLPGLPASFDLSKSGADRPALIVTSTSYTPDEDLGLLLHALDHYDSSSSDLPRLLCLVTGKGPLKSHFENQISELEAKWSKVRVRTLWLESEDYPKLLGSVDIGISLHSSSSGLDLPMKVVDMFGSQLPVLALNFACLGELVHDRQNGFVFDNAENLAKLLTELLRDFPKLSEIERLRKGIESTSYNGTSWQRWDENWDATMDRVLDL